MPLHSRAQKIEQRQFQRAIGAEFDVGGPNLVRDRLHRGVVRLEALEIVAPRLLGIDIKAAALFHILKKRRLIKRKV